MITLYRSLPLPQEHWEFELGAALIHNAIFLSPRIPYPPHKVESPANLILKIPQMGMRYKVCERVKRPEAVEYPSTSNKESKWRAGASGMGQAMNSIRLVGGKIYIPGAISQRYCVIFLPRYRWQSLRALFWERVWLVKPQIR